MKLKKIFITVIIAILICCSLLAIKVAIKTYYFPIKHEEYILKYSNENNLDPFLVLAVIKAESKFDSEARSHKDAIGLMQITPDTAKWAAKEMGLGDFKSDYLLNEEYNIRMGCWYLANLREEFQKQDLYIAAYNAGRGRVSAWLQDKNYSSDGTNIDYIPYSETKKYVDRVNTYYRIYKFLYKEF